MGFLADDVGDIAANWAKLRKDQGLPDQNWKTASTSDLEACAAGYEIYRKPAEGDYDLRKRIEAIADRIKAKKGIAF